MSTTTAPLADRMRPRELAEVLGQAHLTAPGKILHQALAADHLPSLIFWGPPGCGKTTLARVISHHTRHHFAGLSAVLSGIKDVRAVIDRAERRRASNGPGTILFVDEIHRFNKGQQDGFLPFVENGTIVLIGATTENPSFELNGALLSRCRVMVLNPLDEPALVTLLRRALGDPERGLAQPGLRVGEGVCERIAALADGDARHALNVLETFVQLSGGAIAADRELAMADLESSLDRRAALYDKAGEGHFNLISALHKSLRGSDVDASLYWLARMVTAGEDGLYIARRMIRFASEDIGNADPRALTVALNAKESYHFLGAPEGELALAQAAIYLATAPKSNSVYMAWKAAQKCAADHGSPPPPRHILNAPTRLMKTLGYGEGYRYAHDYENGYVAQEYLPETLAGERFYQPVSRGFERQIERRLNYWRTLKNRKVGTEG